MLGKVAKKHIFLPENIPLNLNQELINKIGINQYSQPTKAFKEPLDFNDARNSQNSKWSQEKLDKGITIATELEDLPRAIKYYNDAIQLNRDNKDAYKVRAIAYSQQGKYEDSISDFQKVLKLDPDDSQAQEALLKVEDKIKEKQHKRMLMTFGYELKNAKQYNQGNEHLLVYSPKPRKIKK
ncbi:unnamed protein product [Blepharisma stoltei]|uniref:Tetratricopeptide repeat protein n=1 Tax=Blepharisma stoltei TaxID=1481888 RepID=A0AAU9K8P1_9CILI|nr:unnamed protein product [Blepharisma stoltei]